MSAETRRWLLDTTERCVKTFLEAYFAIWFVVGADFDHLFTVDNLKGGVVGLALALALAVGARKVGAEDSASYLPADVDPPQPLMTLRPGERVIPAKDLKKAAKKPAPAKKATKKRA